MINRLIIFLILVSGKTSSVLSQTDSFKYKGKRDIQQCISYENIHIAEDSLYTFKIEKISPLQDGYLIKATTHPKKGTKSRVFIVSPMSDTEPCLDREKLKVGKKYTMSVRKYFFRPSDQFAIESVQIVDALLGNKTISVHDGGSFYYLYVSNNLNDLYVRPESYIEPMYNSFARDSVAIQKSVHSFLRDICFNEKNYDFVDTVSLRKSFLRYGAFSRGRSSEDLNCFCSRHPWSIDSIPYKQPNYSRWYPDTNSFQNLLSVILEEDNLLLTDSLPVKQITNMEYKLLYSPRLGIYTIQVVWEVDGKERLFVAIITVEKRGNNYVVIGLNKANKRYSDLKKSRREEYFIEKTMEEKMFF